MLGTPSGLLKQHLLNPPSKYLFHTKFTATCRFLTLRNVSCAPERLTRAVHGLPFRTFGPGNMHGSPSTADNTEAEVRRGFVWTLKRLGRLGRANCSSTHRALDSVSQTLDSCNSTGGSSGNTRRQPGCSLLPKPWLMGHGLRPDATGTAIRPDASKTAAAGADSDMVETHEVVNSSAVGAAAPPSATPCRRSSTTDLPQQSPANAALLTYLRDGAVTPAVAAPSPSNGRRVPLLSHSTNTICRTPRSAANTPAGGSPLPALQPTICELSSWEATAVPAVSHAALYSSPVHPSRSEQLLSSVGQASALQQQLSAPLCIPAGWPHSTAGAAVVAGPWTLGHLPQHPIATSPAFCPSPGAPGTPMPSGLVRTHSDATPPSLLARQPAFDRPSPPGPMATTAAAAMAASAGEGIVAGGDGAAAGTADSVISDSMLLAVCPNLPPGMRRQVWSIQDYTDVAKLFKSSTSAVYKVSRSPLLQRNCSVCPGVAGYRPNRRSVHLLACWGHLSISHVGPCKT